MHSLSATTAHSHSPRIMRACTIALLPLFISPTRSANEFESTDIEDDGGGDGKNNQYASIYVTMIIVMSILFVVVICCLLYRMVKKRKAEGASSKLSKSSTGGANHGGGDNANDHADHNHLGPQQEQVKFRGSMSSVENRHERIPSKPVVIAITTPRGTRHVADAFGDFDGDEEADPNLPGTADAIPEEKPTNQNQTKSESEEDDDL